MPSFLYNPFPPVEILDASLVFSNRSASIFLTPKHWPFGKVLVRVSTSPASMSRSSGADSGIDYTHMKSNDPSFGTPEGDWAAFASRQLARRYHLPYRGNSGLTMTNGIDA